jgi:hypothetical protein
MGKWEKEKERNEENREGKLRRKEDWETEGKIEKYLYFVHAHKPLTIYIYNEMKRGNVTRGDGTDSYKTTETPQRIPESDYTALSYGATKLNLNLKSYFHPSLYLNGGIRVFLWCILIYF